MCHLRKEHKVEVWFGNCQDIETGPYCFKVSKEKNLIRPSERSTLD